MPVSALLLGLALAASAAAAQGPEAWSHETLGAVWAAPAVDTQGRVYVGAEDGFLYAFTPEGRLRWVYKASDGFSGWPAHLWDRVVVGNRNGSLYVFDAGGDVRQTIEVQGVPLGPVARGAGMAYVGTTGGQVVAIGRAGLRWIHDTRSPVTGYPAAQGRQIVAGCKNGAVLALDSAGRLQWRVPLASAVRGSLALTANLVVVAQEAGGVVALDRRTGSERWRHQSRSAPGGVVSLGQLGVVLGTSDGKILGLDLRGKERFNLSADGGIRGTPLVTPDRILVGTEGGTVYLLDHDGAPWGLYPVSGPVRGGITLHRGRILVGTTHRRLHVIPLTRRGPWQRAPGLKRELKRSPQGRLLWRRDLSGPVATGVARAKGGQLVAGTWGRRLFVLQSDGKVAWSYNCDADIDTLPLMDNSGALAFGCNDGGFYGLKPNGDLRFRIPVNKAIASSPAGTRDGTVYFGARDSRLYAVDRTGKVLWRIRTGGDVDGSPRVGPDGMIYVGSDDRHLYAVDPLGQISWYKRLLAPIRSRPAIGPKQTILATALDQRLHAFSATGEHLWELQTGGQIVSWPTVDRAGNVFFGSRDHQLHAVTKTGRPLWRFRTAGEVDGNPQLSLDGELVLVGSDDGNLYAVRRDSGQLAWWFPARAAVRGSLVARRDGSVVLGTMDGAVLAVAPPGEQPASAPSMGSNPREERFVVGQGRYGPPLHLGGGIIAVAGVDGALRAFGPDRWPLWTSRVGRDRLSRPVTLPGEADSLCVTDARGALSCLRAGQLRFRLRLDRAPLSAPGVVASDDGPLLLTGTRSGRLWAVTPGGKVRWFHVGRTAIETAPLSLGRTILVAEGAALVGLDLTGHQRYRVELPAGITAGPVALSPTRAVVGDGLGHLWGVSAAGQVVWKRDLGAGVHHLRAGSGTHSVSATTVDGRAVELSADGEWLAEVFPDEAAEEIATTGQNVSLLIGAEGTVLQLDRRTAAISRRLELSSNRTFVSRGPAGELALVTDDGRVTLLHPEPGTASGTKEVRRGGRGGNKN